MTSRLWLAALLLVAVSSYAQTTPSFELKGPSATRRVTAAELAAMPRAKVTISDHGTDATFEGVTLTHLFSLVRPPAGEKPHREDLTKYALVDAADGYRALFALPELDPAFTDRLVILADTRDGKPLPEKEGPFRVIVQNEKRQARCVRQVTRIAIRAAE